MNTNKLIFRLIYLFLSPFRVLPHSVIHSVGRGLGIAAYYLHPTFRKRALSNLSLAKGLQLDEKSLKRVAKESFQNLLINCLEYPKFASEKDISRSVVCKNPELAEAFIKKGQGIVFFCGHQSNWEVLFLDGTRRMPGVAIGRPIKNLYLYHWIHSIRQRFGGKIITPQNAIKEGFKSLKRGMFLGIVGDQGMPESGFQSPFLGRIAWTSPAPALLAYKAKCPIMVATTKRQKGKYIITYSDPIWPDFDKPIDEELPNLMKASLAIFEKSIIENPGEWLWQHNRWKQETPRNVYYRYRYDSILIILPSNTDEFNKIKDDLAVFKEIYPLAFLTVLTQERLITQTRLEGAEILTYRNEKDLYLKDYRFKLVYNFSGYPKIKKHYLSMSAMKVVDLLQLKKEAKEHLKQEMDYKVIDIIKRAVCRPGTTWEKENASQ